MNRFTDGGRRTEQADFYGSASRPFAASRRRVWQTWLIAAALSVALLPARAEDAKPLYENNFEKAAAGSVPEDFLVLDGAFAVKADATNKFLELPGAPLDTYGALFGPTEKTDLAVSARIFSTAKGRRFPTFAIGLNGQGGYRVQVSPGKKALEIYRGDEAVATAPFDWKSGQWTNLKLQVVKSGEAWQVEGKAWPAGEPEPAKAQVAFVEKTEPTAGRASLWGSPYSTTPIQYDDLLVQRVASGGSVK